mmetsp:Transcript_109436/g.282909  ORF Transcript_109436/g.282909 Transcript_109436/m.282909 type:complete len:174 (-) Transcript_109436:90-611(-)
MLAHADGSPGHIALGSVSAALSGWVRMQRSIFIQLLAQEQGQALIIKFELCKFDICKLEFCSALRGWRAYELANHVVMSPASQRHCACRVSEAFLRSVTTWICSRKVSGQAMVVVGWRFRAGEQVLRHRQAHFLAFCTRCNSFARSWQASSTIRLHRFFLKPLLVVSSSLLLL